MASKTTSFLFLCYKLLYDFWFLHDFELITLCLMISRSKGHLLDLKIQNDYRQHTNKSVFLQLNYNIILCLMEIEKIDYVIRRIRLQGFRNWV